MAYNSALLSHVLAVALSVLGALQAPPRVDTGSVVVLGISLWIVLHYSSTWPLGPGGRGRREGRGGEVVNEVRISARDVCVVNRNDTFHNWRGSLVGGVSCFQGAFSKSSLLLFCSSLCPSLWYIRGPSASLLFYGLLELVVSQRVLERFESRCLPRIVLLRKAEMQLTVLLPRSNLFEGLEVRHLTLAVTFASSDVPDIAMVDYYLMCSG